MHPNEKVKILPSNILLGFLAAAQTSVDSAVSIKGHKNSTSNHNLARVTFRGEPSSFVTFSKFSVVIRFVIRANSRCKTLPVNFPSSTLTKTLEGQNNILSKIRRSAGQIFT